MRGNKRDVTAACYQCLVHALRGSPQSLPARTVASGCCSMCVQKAQPRSCPAPSEWPASAWPRRSDRRHRGNRRPVTRLPKVAHRATPWPPVVIAKSLCTALHPLRSIPPAWAACPAHTSSHYSMPIRCLFWARIPRVPRVLLCGHSTALHSRCERSP